MTKIEWTEKTWNPIVGCSKVSAGCAHCYAETMARRLKAMGRPEYQDAINDNGRWTGHVTLVPERLEEPLKRKKPTTYFVNSMSDLFHKSVPDEFIERVFAVMERCKQHTFQVLTKRAKRMRDFCNHPSGKRMPAFNVWAGVTVESAAYIDRIDYLRQTYAAMRFVSLEPLLDDVAAVLRPEHLISCNDCGNRGSTAYEIGYDAFAFSLCNKACIKQGERPVIDWLIAGCESGPYRRPAEIDWFRSLRDQCVAAEVPFFLKQMDVNGELIKMPELDGRKWQQVPEVQHDSG